MPTDYEAIATENVIRRGTDFGDIGEFLAERLYSDVGHFVYEILQNAEDAMSRRMGAKPETTVPRRVVFRLFPDRLEVHHWGALFSSADVRGICDVLRGTKPNDPLQIGRFGIGFKSVYGVTSSPEIHSGDEHFLIERYIRPRAVAARPLEPDETLIVLPFNHHRQTAAAAYALIASRLEQLPPTTILFLASIDEIVCEIEDTPVVRLARRVTTLPQAQFVYALSTRRGVADEEEWLVFRQPVVDDHGVVTSKLEIAFKIVTDLDGNPIVTSLHRSALHVYFPTDRETNLGFLLQGPFETTPARDNISTSRRNTELIDAAGDLVVRALHDLKGMGMLTPTLFEALPVQTRRFPLDDPFSSIYVAVRDALQREMLLPTADGGFTTAANARLARGSELRTLLRPEQMKVLFPDDEAPAWLASEITTDRFPTLRAYLMRELGVPEISSEVFASAPGQFFSRQTDAWLVDFYEFLQGHEALWRAGRSKWDRPGLLRRRPIIRTERDVQVTPFTEEGTAQVYLPGAGRTELPTVKRVIATDPRAHDFLIRLGLSEPDMIDDFLERVLPKYQVTGPADGVGRGPVLGHSDNMAQLQTVVKIAAGPKFRSLVAVVSQAAFFRGRNALTGKIRHLPAAQLHVPTSELEDYFAGNPDAWFLADREPWLAALWSDFGFATSIRAQAKRPNANNFVSLASGHGRHERGLDGFDPGATVEGLTHALNTITLDKARTIWNKIAVPNAHLIHGTVEKATRQDYTNAKRLTVASTFGQALREAAWVPTRDGQFHRPRDLSIDQLQESLRPDERVLTALGIESAVGAVAARYNVELSALQAILEHPDLLAEMAERISERTRKAAPAPVGGVDYASELVGAVNRPATGIAEDQDDWDAGSSGVRDPELRRNRLADEIAVARAAEPVTPATHVVVGDGRVSRNRETRAFLVAEYAGKCQICRDTFRMRSGRQYFEAVYLASRRFASWLDRPGNALCLCASCSAKFQHGVVSSPDDIVQQVLHSSAPGTDRLTLDVTICGEPAQVQYSQRHMLELQAIVQSVSAPDRKPADVAVG